MGNERSASSGGMMMHGVNLKRRFFVSLVLAVPILLLSSPMGLALLPITLSFSRLRTARVARAGHRCCSSAAGRFCAARRTGAQPQARR